MLAKTTHDFAQYLPWLATIAVKTSLLLLMALAAGQLLRRASAALRHLIYVASVTGVLLLPVASIVVARPQSAHSAAKLEYSEIRTHHFGCG